MKKIFTTILAASMMLVGLNAFAQMSVGAGYVNSDQRFRLKKDSKPEVGNLSGFYAGGEYNIDLMKYISIAPGIQYEFLASKESQFLGIKSKLQEHYVNVPVNVRFNFPLANDLRLFAFGGPTLSCGIVSKSIANIPIIGEKKLDNYGKNEISGDKSSYGRFDVMLGAGLGFEALNAIQVKVGYDWGLLDRNSTDAIQHRNRLYIGVAYMF